MANHCIDVICLECGANYCLRCGQRYDSVVDGKSTDNKRELFTEGGYKEEWRHWKNEECSFCKHKALYSDPWW